MARLSRGWVFCALAALSVLALVPSCGRIRYQLLADGDQPEAGAPLPPLVVPDASGAGAGGGGLSAFDAKPPAAECGNGRRETGEDCDDDSLGCLQCLQLAVLLLGDEPPFAADLAIRDHLVAEGASVTVIEDIDSTRELAEMHDLVLIGAGADRANPQDELAPALVPMIVGETALLADLEIGGRTPDSNVAQLEIVDPLHPLAAGFDGTVTIFSVDNSMPWGTAAPGCQVVAVNPNDATDIALFACDREDELLTGTAPARRVGCPIAREAHQLNDDGWTLFDASVLWAVGRL